MPSENRDRCHRFWPTYSIDVIEEGNRKERWKETPLEKRWGIGYLLTSIKYVGQKQ